MGFYVGCSSLLKAVQTVLVSQKILLGNQEILLRKVNAIMATIQDVQTQEQAVVTAQQAETTAIGNLTTALQTATTGINQAIADFKAQLQALLGSQPTEEQYQQAITLAQQMQSTVTANTSAIATAVTALTNLGTSVQQSDPGQPTPPPPAN